MFLPLVRCLAVATEPFELLRCDFCRWYGTEGLAYNAGFEGLAPDVQKPSRGWAFQYCRGVLCEATPCHSDETG
jgi:hypothetical protein